VNDDLTLLSAVDAAEGIRAGRFSSEQLVSQYLALIDATNDAINAWAYLDRDGALERARQADWFRKLGRSLGPLHGVPVGIKDIIDVRGMPTGLGNATLCRDVPATSARVVENLLEAGAVIMGKTTTCELAYLTPTITTNPHNEEYSPGGSSSGSAAAVAARHVPIAIGSQTGGSVIRPASYCGTYGFKPSRGITSRIGFFQTSATLDQVGVFTNHLEDAALVSDVIGSLDQRDEASYDWPRPDMSVGVKSDVPVAPSFCWFDMPYHEQCDTDVLYAIEQIVDMLGDQVDRLPVAPELAMLPVVHKTIYDYEIARNLEPLITSEASNLSVELTDAHERGIKITKVQYQDALDVKLSSERFFTQHFMDYDAILAPSATGIAPLRSLGTTGNAINCLIWTLAGLPCITLPLFLGKNDMPFGLQLIGGKQQDDRLFRTSAWLQNFLQTDLSQEGEE